MKKTAELLFAILCLISPLLHASPTIVCAPTGGNPQEQNALHSTLSSMGYTVRATNTPWDSDCAVAVFHPGNGLTAGYHSTVASWVQSGKGVVQISDWGPDLLNNSWNYVGSSAVTVTIMDPGHPITNGVPASWLAKPFWIHGIGGSGGYIGWAFSGNDLARVSAAGTTAQRGLAASDYGAGRTVYIGWNVTGSYAGSHDLRILRNAVDWTARVSLNDVDADGVEDANDNCPNVPNPSQIDSDGDGSGDHCDVCPLDAGNDADGDGYCADIDNCATAPNADQDDQDADGTGDVCDVCPQDAANDADGDGRCANDDNCPLNANADQSDRDGDGTGDACDTAHKAIADSQSLTINEDTIAGIILTGTEYDAEPLVYSIVGNPSNGSLSPISGNSVTYTPAADYNGNDSFTFKLNDSDAAAVTITITPVNDAPAVSISAADSADEGSAVPFGGVGSDVDGDSLTYTWDFGDGTSASGASVAHSYADDGLYTVKVTVSDGSLQAEASKLITINNVAPSVSITGAPATSPEGSTISVGRSVSDPGSADTHSYSWSVTKNGAPYATSPTFTPDDDGTYVVSVTATDDDGGSATDSATILVTNLNPTVTSLTVSHATIDENGIITLSGTYGDPGSADTHVVSISWGDGATSSSPVAGGTFAASHQYLDDAPSGTAADPYSIDVTITDDNGGASTGSASVTVQNVAPLISSVTGPGPVPVNTAASISVSHSDVGTQDTHTCTATWDDGSTTACSTPHIFTAAGVYAIGITVTDDDTGSASTSYQYIVVYDPSAGFVTGGGWINSAAGAYRPDATLAGKAHFGFVSKYQKGQSIPTGETQFQFQVASLSFHSTSYDWLVIAGAKAQYKGVGKINGAGNYGFLLTATDGQVTGGGGVDKFRIKIWDKNNSDAIVYDNAPGSDDIDSSVTQAIDGGSIVIHSGKK